jgi:ABC-type cobalamin transport system ATPase subunit
VDQGPADLRADIRLTLGRMTRVVDAISYKLQVKERLRERLEELRRGGWRRVVGAGGGGEPGPSVGERATQAVEGRPTALAAVAASVALSGLIVADRVRRSRARSDDDD